MSDSFLRLRSILGAASAELVNIHYSSLKFSGDNAFFFFLEVTAFPADR